MQTEIYFHSLIIFIHVSVVLSLKGFKMPKFVSGSSGHIYANDKSDRKPEDGDIETILPGDASHASSAKKPEAINKKNTKEKHKNSLDLFKEELRRLHEEREEKRHKIKKSSRENSVRYDETDVSSLTRSQTIPVPVPLKPDPRCPTSLTLQVNINPKDKDSSICGSYDTGDPTTTNLYLGNINPHVNENDLCNLFGKFGPLASIKIMWPRTDEERARNRNSGFVAYMSRIDAERALKALNGKDLMGYDMKLGWGKAVPLPQNPVYVPPELLKLTQPPPQSGLPFNGQLHEIDVDRGYKVPYPYPKPLPPELESEVVNNPELKVLKEAHDEFMEVIGRSTVRVTQPSDRNLLDRIHKTIEYLIREGPAFEAIIIARESKNPEYRFLYDNQSQDHVYYRWKLYSLLHGDDPLVWKIDEFRMFEGGPLWKPPPLNPYANGMPVELIEPIQSTVIKTSSVQSQKVPNFIEKTLDPTLKDDSRIKGTLGPLKREMLGDLLRNLDPTKVKIGALMLFCINHADAAVEIIECIYESLKLLETPFQKKLARLFLISDILHNCSAAVTNASFYRKGFQSNLISIFEYLREYLINIEDRYKADRFKQKVLSVLGAWKEWTLYEDEFVIKLSNILLGIEHKESHDQVDHGLTPVRDKERPCCSEDDLDGHKIDDKTLADFLEAKGLSLRWYKALDLSDDESEEERIPKEHDQGSKEESMIISGNNKRSITSERVRFKSSKWETVDPSEVAEQVVTISKWESMAKGEDQSPESTTDGSTNCDDNYEKDQMKLSRKRFRSDELHDK